MKAIRNLIIAIRNRNKLLLLSALVLLIPPHAKADNTPSSTAPPRMRYLPAGTYTPLFKTEGTRPVAPFYLDEYPVTNEEYLEFVRANPAWRRSHVKAVFSDESYLKHWADDLNLGPHREQIANSPVTYVSWFAAHAFADWKKKRLPTLAEWEYAASASEEQPEGKDETNFYQRILDWYGLPTPEFPPPVGSTFKNYWGIYDMHGLAWEWVDDFNTALVTGESRSDTGLERKFFCGSGSVGTSDFKDYAAFMRYAFRSSLEAEYTVKNLGFRCALDAGPNENSDQTRNSVERELPGNSIYHLSSIWQDQDGTEMSLIDLRGTVRIVAMFFSNCEYACPVIIADLKKIIGHLPPETLPHVGIELFSFDSKRDTPRILKQFAERMELNPDQWTLFHGEPKDVRDLAAALGVRFRQDPSGQIAHSNIITLLNAQGEIVYQQKGLEADPTTMVRQIIDTLTLQSTPSDVPAKTEVIENEYL